MCRQLAVELIESSHTANTELLFVNTENNFSVDTQLDTQ